PAAAARGHRGVHGGARARAARARRRGGGARRRVGRARAARARLIAPLGDPPEPRPWQDSRMTAITQGPLGHPYRWSAPERREAAVRVEGALPSWLEGRLIRTAPALFELGRFRAEHWFDGFGMLYAFELGAEPKFKQRLLRSRALEDA